MNEVFWNDFLRISVLSSSKIQRRGTGAISEIVAHSILNSKWIFARRDSKKVANFLFKNLLDQPDKETQTNLHIVIGDSPALPSIQ